MLNAWSDDNQAFLMASNKENQLVGKDADNLVEETNSKISSIESENKLKVFSEDKIPTQEEVISNGFACFGFNKSILNSLENKGYKSPHLYKKQQSQN